MFLTGSRKPCHAPGLDRVGTLRGKARGERSAAVVAALEQPQPAITRHCDERSQTAERTQQAKLAGPCCVYNTEKTPQHVGGRPDVGADAALHPMSL